MYIVCTHGVWVQEFLIVNKECHYCHFILVCRTLSLGRTGRGRTKNIQSMFSFLDKYLFCKVEMYQYKSPGDQFSSWSQFQFEFNKKSIK